MKEENSTLDLLSDNHELLPTSHQGLLSDGAQPQDEMITASTGEVEDEEPQNEELVTAIQSYIEQVV
jgi:hypothetical protein